MISQQAINLARGLTGPGEHGAYLFTCSQGVKQIKHYAKIKSIDISHDEAKRILAFLMDYHDLPTKQAKPYNALILKHFPSSLDKLI